VPALGSLPSSESFSQMTGLSPYAVVRDCRIEVPAPNDRFTKEPTLVGFLRRTAQRDKSNINLNDVIPPFLSLICVVNCRPAKSQIASTRLFTVERDRNDTSQEHESYAFDRPWWTRNARLQRELPRSRYCI